MAASAKRLKKRSVANSTSPKPPEELTFFLDRQLGRYKMAGALRKAGLNIEIHDDHFPQNAEDTEWLTAAGKRNWIVVTRDERIRYRVAERQAIRRAKVRAFVLAAQGHLRAEMLAEIFLKALPKIRRTVKQRKPPFIAKISRGGDLTVLEF
jgi:predicted nuclease of predicted toxin-antitoxin system